MIKVWRRQSTRDADGAERPDDCSELARFGAGDVDPIAYALVWSGQGAVRIRPHQDAVHAGVPVRALGTRARCVPVTSGTDGHSGSLAVDENAVPPGARRCHLHRKDA